MVVKKILIDKIACVDRHGILDIHLAIIAIGSSKFVIFAFDSNVSYDINTSKILENTAKVFLSKMH